MRIIVFCFCLVIAVYVNAQTVAGKVAFAFGTVSAVDTNGALRVLKKGDEVYARDKLVTKEGRLQLHMRDGAFISVQPNSEYLIEDYKFNNVQDGSESAVYRLLKGGIRAISGLIGKKNRDAYKVHTPAATIGIRGTGHNTRICSGDCGEGVKDGLYHSTTEGTTYVKNETGITEVPKGKSVYIANNGSTPESKNEGSSTTSSQSTNGEYTDGEQRDENGNLIAIDATIRAETGTKAFYAYNHNQGTSFDEFFSVILNADDDGTDNKQIFVNTSNNNVISFKQSGCPFSTPCSYDGEGIELTDVGNNTEYGFAWARTKTTGWKFDGDNNALLGSFHALTLKPANQTTNLPTSGVASYTNIVGSTSPTGSTTNGGTLSSVNIGINFGTAQFETFDLTGTTGEGLSFAAALIGTPAANTSGSVPLTGTCTLCSGGLLSGVAHYGFAGSNAEAIGFSYGLHSDSTLNSDVVSGVAVVTQ